MSKGKNHSPEFKAKVALETLKGERTVAELASQFGVQAPAFRRWRPPPAVVYWLRKDETQLDQQEQKVA